MAVWTPVLEDDTPDLGREFRQRVLGTDFSGEAAFKSIEQGLNMDALDNLLAFAPDLGHSIAHLLGISDRTLARRRRQGHLTPVESDRLYRLVDLYAEATRVLDGIEAVNEWMQSPAVALGDRTPLEFAANEAGAKRVKALLTRIEHGVYS
ncbi:MAG: antitoxin Xre/MbcA/ParS toxin-binding domain-containing protein [Trueperaceae bacterium]